MAGKKLSRKQVATLGGLARARKAGAKGMSEAGAKGGQATVDNHGRDHMMRIALKRHGYEVSL